MVGRLQTGSALSSTLEGTIRWQDPELLALETGSDEPLVMVARAGLLTLRPLA